MTATLTKVLFTDYSYFWNSNTLDWAYYDADTSTLGVVFLTGDTLYTYLDVPAGVWEDFKNADSAGAFYHANIRGRYVTAPPVSALDVELDKRVEQPETVVSVYEVASQIVEKADEPFEYKALAHIVVPLVSANPSDLAKELTELIEAYNYAGWAYAVSDVELVNPAVWDL